MKIVARSARRKSLILFLATVITAPPMALTANSSLAQELDPSQEISIGIGNEPPYTELKPDGTLTGAGPDIDIAILKQAGLTKFTGTPMAYGSMVPAILAGRVKMLSSGSLAIMPERCKQVIFAEPVMCNSDAFLTRADSAEIDTYAKAASLNVKIAAQSGSSQQRDAIAAGVAQQNIVVYPDGMSAVKMLQDGRVDVIAMSDAGAVDIQKRLGDQTLQVVLPVKDAKVYCASAAFSKEDTALRDAYNVGLAKLMKAGEIEKTLESYGLGAQAKLLASAPTTAELCEQ